MIRPFLVAVINGGYKNGLISIFVNKSLMPMLMVTELDPQIYVFFTHFFSVTTHFHLKVVTEIYKKERNLGMIKHYHGH